MHRDPRFSHFDVIPLTGCGLGAEIRGLDLAAGRASRSSPTSAARSISTMCWRCATSTSRRRRCTGRAALRPVQRQPGSCRHGGLRGHRALRARAGRHRQGDRRGLAHGPRLDGEAAGHHHAVRPKRCRPSAATPASPASSRRTTRCRPHEDAARGLTGMHSGKGVFAINAAHKRPRRAQSDGQRDRGLRDGASGHLRASRDRPALCLRRAACSTASRA